MVYALGVTTGLLVFVPTITCAAADPFAFAVPLDPDGIQRTVVEADSYEFSPRHLVVQAREVLRRRLEARIRVQAATQDRERSTPGAAGT